MKTLYLSPSVQERNVGYGNYGTEEYRCNQIADFVEEVLCEHGVKVYRNKPTMTLSQIVNESNQYNVDMHLAIHTNAYDKKTRGMEIYVHEKGGYSENFAKCIYDRIEALTPVKDRGVKQGKNFYGTGKHMYEIANVSCTRALIEVAFHDEKNDAQWVIENIEEIGINIARGILEYLGIKYKENKQDSDSDVLYRVMVGSYRNLKNAKKHVESLKGKMDSCIMPYKN